MMHLSLPAVSSGAPTLDTIHNVDCLTLLRALPDNSINCVVTSPPYFGLRDYGVTGQIGLEPTPQAFVATMTAVFHEVKRVLREDGTAWVNLGDSYAAGKAGRTDYGTGDVTSTLGPRHNGLPNNTRPGPVVTRSVPDGYKPKDLLGIPWRVAFALQDDGWYLRSDIIWHKPNPMPESVTDRPTKAHEYVFLLSKCERYWYDADAVREPAEDWGSRDRSNNKYQTDSADKFARRSDTFGLKWDFFLTGRNRRSVWTVPTEPTPFAHFATFPQRLIEPMILAGCPVGGVVLDPFMGSGTTALVARTNGRHYIGSELNSEYVALAQDRLRQPFVAVVSKRDDDVSHLPLFAAVAS